MDGPLVALGAFLLTLALIWFVWWCHQDNPYEIRRQKMLKKMRKREDQ